MLGNLIVDLKDDIDQDQDMYQDQQAEVIIKKEIKDVDMEPEVESSPLTKETEKDVEFFCDWDGCGIYLEDLKQLVIHVNSHVDSLSWKDGGDNKCRWKKCWNTHSFQNKLRMIEHMRAHTLEKPFECPVKSCGLKFAIRSNCMAHGRTRHNRSFKPIVVDISKDVEIELHSEEEEEEYKRKPKRKPLKRNEKQRENDFQNELKLFQDYQKQLEKYTDLFEYCQSESLASKARLEILSEHFDNRYKTELDELVLELEQAEAYVNETRDIITNQVIPLLND
ncbi:hypothetical protein HDV04_004658 [Boothiomyces sp. JEL0838]|nr:hypothetical protein HDV04_004641 [Boothiomyces sp. JEL0838]KAJ3310793.1 hypothetical protein HDV04_004658 [Boothiomyces sp. JEL0838]